MIDARTIYRKVTRKIYDFSPEQLANLTSIVWLYRGRRERFIDLVARHIENTLDVADACFHDRDPDKTPIAPLDDFLRSMQGLQARLAPLIDSLER